MNFFQTTVSVWKYCNLPVVQTSCSGLALEISCNAYSKISNLEGNQEFKGSKSCCAKHNHCTENAANITGVLGGYHS